MKATAQGYSENKNLEISINKEISNQNTHICKRAQFCVFNLVEFYDKIYGFCRLAAVKPSMLNRNFLSIVV